MINWLWPWIKALRIKKSDPKGYPFTPLQLEWLSFLENNEQLQGSKQLGKLSEDRTCVTELCCLGAGLYVNNGCKINGLFFDNSGDLLDSLCGNIYTLEHTYSTLNLKSKYGDIIGRYTVEGVEYTDLTLMNDAGIPWTVIAKCIRENPSAVFDNHLL